MAELIEKKVRDTIGFSAGLTISLTSALLIRLLGAPLDSANSRKIVIARVNFPCRLKEQVLLENIG